MNLSLLSKLLFLGMTLLLCVLTGCVEIEEFIYRKAIADVKRFTSTCLPTVVSLNRTKANPITCSVLCNDRKECSSFQINAPENSCLLYPLIVLPPQAVTTGTDVIYTKLTHRHRDLIRGMPVTASKYDESMESFDIVTSGIGCIDGPEWCHGPQTNYEDILITLDQSYTIDEMFFTVPNGRANDYIDVVVHVGELGTTQDPVFSDTLEVTPKVGERISVKGNRTGRFIRIVNNRRNVVICAILLEVYGY